MKKIYILKNHRTGIEFLFTNKDKANECMIACINYFDSINMKHDFKIKEVEEEQRQDLKFEIKSSKEILSTIKNSEKDIQKYCVN